MEDIEDMFKNDDDDTTQQRVVKSKVMRKAKAPKAPSSSPPVQEESKEGHSHAGAEGTDACCGDGMVLLGSQFGQAQDLENEDSTIGVDESALPGKQKVFVKTYGCSHNISDSEYMAGLLADYGFKLVDKMENADACLINSCTVKNPSQEKFVNLVQTAKALKKPVIVSGCVPQGDRNIKGLEDVSVIGVTQIDRVVEVVEEALKGHIVKLLAKKELPLLDLPKIRKNQYVEIIPLSTGCLGSCTYCKTRHARGKLGSYDPNAIVDRVRQAIEEGVIEIWLTSEDTGAYGRDIGTSLPELLKKIIDVMPPPTMLRVGMTNPPYILEHLDEMADILNHPRVYSFLHVPVQSGSNNVLDKMNREYLIEEFHEVCDFLKEYVPDITLATDIICGFPTENEADHAETIKLVEKYKFPVLNISQFYPRPGTVAAKWKKVPTADVKKRSSAVTKVFDSYTTNLHYMGETVLVWIIGFDDRKTAEKTQKPQLLGHTKSYTKVVINQDEASLGGQPAEALLGRVIEIKVTETHKWHISGHITNANPKVPHPASNAAYFAERESQRVRERAEASKGTQQPTVKVREEKVKVPITNSQLFTHLAGMAALSVGVFLTLRGVFGQPPHIDIPLVKV